MAPIKTEENCSQRDFKKLVTLKVIYWSHEIFNLKQSNFIVINNQWGYLVSSNIFMN